MVFKMYNHKNGCILRKLRRDDLSDLLALKNESWWGTHKTIVANEEDQNKWFDSIPSNSLFMIAQISILNADLESFGVAVYNNIDYQNRSLSISGSIFKKHRNSETSKIGFAAGLDFAFEMLNVDRVEAEVLAYNIPAQNLEIDYLGFKIEGKKRNAIFKCGKYYDSIILGMLRSEWENSQRVKKLGDTCNKNFSHNKMFKIQERFSREFGSVADVE